MKSFEQYRNEFVSIITELGKSPNSHGGWCSLPERTHSEVQNIVINRGLSAGTCAFLSVFGGMGIDLCVRVDPTRCNRIFKDSKGSVTWMFEIADLGTIGESIYLLELMKRGHLYSYGHTEEMRATLEILDRAVPIIHNINGDFIVCDCVEGNDKVIYIYMDLETITLAQSLEEFLENWSALNYVGPDMLTVLTEDYLTEDGLNVRPIGKKRIDALFSNLLE